MAVTRTAENTIWFASCNVAHDPHQNCRSLVIAPDGRIHAESELKREELVVADIDIALATRAMYRFDIGEAATDDCAPLLFATAVQKAEYQPEQSRPRTPSRASQPAPWRHWAHHTDGDCCAGESCLARAAGLTKPDAITRP